MSRLPQNLTNATVLFSTSIDHCLDQFEFLEFAQAQLREKSHFTSLFSSQSAVFALCRHEVYGEFFPNHIYIFNEFTMIRYA